MKKITRQPNEPEVQVTSLKSVLEWLKPTLKSIDNPNDLKALEIIVNEIGKCPSCQGNGETLSAFPPPDHYSVHHYPRGQKMYGTKCQLCKGNGKILDIVCVSCGVTADRQPAQRHLTYCQKCEERLTLTGILK
jgi:hypothetical protein